MGWSESVLGPSESFGGFVLKTEALDIDLKKLVISKFNVRKNVGDISELADSIKRKGILQPIVVRPSGKRFEVIIGARRYTAAKRIGLKKVPAIVKELDDSDAILESLTENVQRNNLEPKELGEAILLLKKFDFTEEKIGKALGKSQDSVSDMIRSYELLVRLEKAGKSVEFRPEVEERRKGDSIPYYHMVMAQRAFENPEVKAKLKALPTHKAEERKIQLVEEIAPLTQYEAQKVVDEFKKYPDKPIDELKQQALSRELGVALHTYLPPSLAREIDAISKTTGRPADEVLPDIIKRGISGMEPLHESETEYERLELPLGPISAQIHNKVLWNLERMPGKFDFYTIGYSERSIDQIIELLRKVGIKTLIDVRAEPSSQYKPEFNRKELQEHLKQADITYVHRPELGVPRDIRLKLSKTGDWDELFRWYDDNVKPKFAKSDFESEQSDYPVAYMCVELDPTKCHRHRLAMALEQRGLKGLDL